MNKQKGFTYIEVIASLFCVTVFLSAILPLTKSLYQMHLKARRLYEKEMYIQEIFVEAKLLTDELFALGDLENQTKKEKSIQTFEKAYEEQNFICQLEIEKVSDKNLGYEEISIQEETLSVVNRSVKVSLQEIFFTETSKGKPRLLNIYLENTSEPREFEIIDTQEEDLIIRFVGDFKIQPFLTYQISKDRGNVFIEYTPFVYSSNQYHISLLIVDDKDKVLKKIEDIHCVESF